MELSGTARVGEKHAWLTLAMVRGAYSGSRWVSVWAAVKVWWRCMIELLVCYARGWGSWGEEGGQWSRLLLYVWSWHQHFDWAVNLEGLPVSKSSALNPPFQLSGTWQHPNSFLGFADLFSAIVNFYRADKSIYIWVIENTNFVQSFLSVYLSYFATLSALSLLALPGCHLNLKWTFWFPLLVLPFRYGYQWS